MRLLEILAYIMGYVWAVFIGPEEAELRLARKERARQRAALSDRPPERP